MRRSSAAARFVDSPAPRDVPGYLDAVRAGVTPRVPAHPPSIAVGAPTAHAALRVVFLVVGLAVTATVVVILVGAREGRLGGPVVLAVLGVGGVGITAAAVAVRRFGRAQLAELQRGYTTVRYQLGRWWSASSPDGPVTVGWVQWDWSGTWVLRPSGEVVAAPSRDVDPPGLYPSPRRPGDLELWTGHQWSGHVVERAAGR